MQMSPKRRTSADHWLGRNANLFSIEIIENFNQPKRFGYALRPGRAYMPLKSCKIG